MWELFLLFFPGLGRVAILTTTTRGHFTSFHFIRLEDFANGRQISSVLTSAVSLLSIKELKCALFKRKERGSSFIGSDSAEVDVTSPNE